MSVVIGERETTLPAPTIITSVPTVVGSPAIVMLPPTPLTSMATTSPLPLPIVVLPESVVLPATASELLNVAAPVTPSVPAIAVLPVAGATVKFVPPTVRLAPVTSSPLVASTLPANDTWFDEPV